MPCSIHDFHMFGSLCMNSYVERRCTCPLQPNFLSICVKHDKKVLMQLNISHLELGRKQVYLFGSKM